MKNTETPFEYTGLGLGKPTGVEFGAESGNEREGQQEGFLQVHQQHKEGQGKCGLAAEWGRVPAEATEKVQVPSSPQSL